MNKKTLEKKYNVIIDKTIAMDSGSSFYIVHKKVNGDYGECISDNCSTLMDIELLLRKQNRNNIGKLKRRAK